MRQTKYPPGWDEERVHRVLEHYETQSDEEAVAEDEAAYETTTHTAMEVPVELVPTVRELIAKRRVGRDAKCDRSCLTSQWSGRAPNGAPLSLAVR